METPVWQSLDGTRRVEQVDAGYALFLRGEYVGLTSWPGVPVWLNGRMPELLPEPKSPDSPGESL